jgi:hypothetical protein
MKKKELLILILNVSMLFALILSAGLLNSQAFAAGEQIYGLDSYSTEQDSSMAVCTPDTAGMRAYWPFEDDSASTIFADVIANPTLNNGACVGVDCPVSTTNGKVGSAYVFDGSDEIDVADTSGLDFSISGDITLETWVKTTQDCTGRVVFVGRYEGLPLAAWWLGCDENNKAAFHMRDSLGTALTISGTTIINDGQWHHVVGTRDGTANVNRIYVDGKLENSGTPAFTGTLTFTDKVVTIGYFAPSPFYHLNGTLDEMALYDHALSLEEISRHYLNGNGKPYCTSETVYLPIVVNNN